MTKADNPLDLEWLEEDSLVTRLAAQLRSARRQRRQFNVGDVVVVEATNCGSSFRGIVSKVSRTRLILTAKNPRTGTMGRVSVPVGLVRRPS